MKRKSILINHHSHHSLQTSRVRFQLKSDQSRQTTQRYFVFLHFISLPTKKHFLKCVPLLWFASATQLKTNQHQLKELNRQPRWKQQLCILCSQVHQPLQEDTTLVCISINLPGFINIPGFSHLNRSMPFASYWEKQQSKQGGSWEKKGWFFSSLHPNNSGVRLDACSGSKKTL